jgi:hypothetical protein
MIRILLLMIILVFSNSIAVEAGWLDDKLKQAAESVGNRMVDDASDSAYEGAKDAVSPEDNEMKNDTSGQYESGQATEYEEQAEEPEEYSDESLREQMYSPSWTESDYGRKTKKKKKMGPPRTDLHLTTDMVMSDPESGPEPIRGKIYIDGAKLRSEFDYPGGNRAGMIITGIDPADKVYVLMHSEKTYIESSVSETDSFSFGSGKPCEGFLKAVDLGGTTLNGRSVTKWRCSEPEDPEDDEEAGKVMTFWYDKELKIPLRMEDDKRKSYWEMVNIREGKPSGDIFRLPAGYKKLAVGGAPTATSLSGQDEKLIKSANIPLYSKAIFVYGNSSVGYRFASNEPVERVRGWYQAKLSSWPVYEDKYGAWIIYKGEPGAGMGELIMQKTQVSVQKNDKLPEWHSLDKTMTTEIVIMVVQ